MSRVPSILSLSLLCACGTGGGSDLGSSDLASQASVDLSSAADLASMVAHDLSSSLDGGGCTLTAGTAATAVTSASGCAVLTRDTSACDADRTAAGLAGYWRKFSCRVVLSKTMIGGVPHVQVVSDGRPDYLSNYFQSSDPCHEAYTGAIQNPNFISAHSYVVPLPETPTVQTTTMNGTAVVGMALNGVPIFGNFAAPGDDIFQEAKTFDRCGAHPQMQGAYHYHGEPYSITDDDSAFVGVLRDGYPVYGRRDEGGAMPTLDAQGGHTGTTVDSVTPVYHYHVNQQTSTAAGTSGQMQWFLTSGSFHGKPAMCNGCN